jgi:transposase
MELPARAAATPGARGVAAARARPEAEAGRRLFGQCRGVEGTTSQGVRAFGLRRARYGGLAKTAPQHVATAAALDPDRLGAWFADRPLAPTRVSRFAALAA